MRKIAHDSIPTVAGILHRLDGILSIRRNCIDQTELLRLDFHRSCRYCLVDTASIFRKYLSESTQPTDLALLSTQIIETRTTAFPNKSVQSTECVCFGSI